MAETPMERIYLYVPPEEYTGVRLSGAAWDVHSKRWYIEGDVAREPFSRWLGDEDPEAEFALISDEAFVASAHVPCVACHQGTQVICIYCESGTDVEMGDTVQRVTVSNLSAMDEALAAQLARWPSFRRGPGADLDGGCFVNHCTHCGAVQEDYRLHSEPGDVFFDVSDAELGAVGLTPLVGRVRLSGDCGFAL